MSAERKDTPGVLPQEVRGPEELVPVKELLTPDGYRWFVYDFDTGVRLVCLEDQDTGVVVTTPIVSLQTRVAAHKAWAGARQSRSPGTPWEILHEMGLKGVDPDAKLDETFRTYGHASVGDMARLTVDFAHNPMHLCLAVFNNSPINSGQEKSTRYQKKFGETVLHSIHHYLPEGFASEEAVRLESAYQEFGKLSHELFAKHRERLTAAFQEFYNPESGNPSHKSALNARVLDCVRFFLLLGQNSGMSFETSARDWSRIIGEMKASPLPFYDRVAAQLERLFSPTPDEEEQLGYKAEAPSLIRHTEPAPTANKNIVALLEFFRERTDLLSKVQINRQFQGRVEQGVELLPKTYSEAEKMVAQYLLTAQPGLERIQLLEWIHSQKPELKGMISQIIFTGHNNYKEMPFLARTTGMTLVFKSFLGEVRDLNRHRAYGRFVPLPLVFGQPIVRDTAYQILASGFGLPLYLSEVPEFSQLQEEFEKDLRLYYEKLYEFLGRVEERHGDSVDYSFLINLLPLAHQVDIWMHGDPKQGLYMTHQRTRPGGHINYRDLVWQANQLLADSDPYLSGMRLWTRPNPASREEFFDRS